MAAKPAKLRPAQTAATFYSEALSEAERVDFQSALKVQGIDEEIAVLRMRLRSAIASGECELALMLKGIDMLVKAVAAKYKLGPGSEELLEQSLSRVIAEMEEVERGATHGD
jgi:hypothetical protein